MQRNVRTKMKESQAKIWIRTGLLIIFGSIFGMYLSRDISSGNFQWWLGLFVFFICLPIGYYMRMLVPMQFHPEWGTVTLSFDKLYFAIIWLLVIAKFILGRIPSMVLGADLSMCIILGLMAGRLSGICLRVHSLKQGSSTVA